MVLGMAMGVDGKPMLRTSYLHYLRSAVLLHQIHYMECDVKVLPCYLLKLPGSNVHTYHFER